MKENELFITHEGVEKPKYLFHGTPVAGIKNFHPRVSLGSGEVDGPQVFATDDLAWASIMMSSVGKRWSSGKYEGGWYAVIPLTRAEFIAQDKGGYLYALPSISFIKNGRSGVSEHEWKSPVSVEPVATKHITSVLDEMKRLGVKVYFVTDEEYSQYISQGGAHYLKTLQAE